MVRPLLREQKEVEVNIDVDGEDDITLKKGNMTLIRLLILLNKAGEAGMTTMDLYDNGIKSRGHGYNILQKAQNDGLVRYIIQERHNGQFPFIVRYITNSGKNFLKAFMGF